MPVRNRMDDATSDARRHRQREALAALYLALGQAGRDGFIVIDMAEIGDLAKMSRFSIADFVTGFDRCDVIKARWVRHPFTRPTDGQRIAVSRVEVWLHLPEDQALARLEELWEQEKRTGENLTQKAKRIKGERHTAEPVVRVVPEVEPQRAPEPQRAEEPQVTVAPPESTEEIRAIAGPEPASPFAVLAPLRRNEYGALIEAARQYANRRAEVDKAIANLRSMGVQVNEAMLEKAVKFPRDERMENVCELLPYVNRLEQQVDMLAKQLADARQKTIEFAQIKQERDRLKAQLDRRVAESVALQRRADAG